MIVHRETTLTVHDTVAVTHERSALTPTEGRVLCLMGMLSNKQIAHKLKLSEQTVKNHIGAILDKLGAADRTQAVVIGIASGLLKVSVEQNEGR